MVDPKARESNMWYKEASAVGGLEASFMTGRVYILVDCFNQDSAVSVPDNNSKSLG